MYAFLSEEPDRMCVPSGLKQALMKKDDMTWPVKAAVGPERGRRVSYR